MKATRTIGIMAFSMVLAATVAFGGQALPFRETFEAMPSGNWVENSGESTFQIKAGGVVGQYLHMYLDEEEGDQTPELSITFADNYSNVWWFGFAQVTAVPTNAIPDPDDLDDAAAAFCVMFDEDENKHYLMARDNDDWAQLDVFGAVDPTNNWIGYAVHLDYNREEWNIYVTTVASVAATLTKANTDAPLAFSDTYTNSPPTGGLSKFTVRTDVKLDAFEFFTGGLGEFGQTEIAFTGETLSAGRWYASVISDKVYAGGQNNLTGALGDDLAAGLVPGDAIRFFTEDGWLMYVLNGDGAWERLAGAVNPGDLEGLPGMAIWFKYLDVRGPAMVTSDRQPATLDQLDISIPSVNLAGTDKGSVGWTAVAWTRKTGGRFNQIGLSAALQPIPAFRAYVIPKGSVQAQYGYWTGTTWNPGADIVVNHMDTIWILSPQEADLLWNVQ